MVNTSGVFKGSTIDHMSTNVEHLRSYMLVIVIMTLQKITRIVPDKSSTMKKRIYKNFSEDTFLAELIDNDVNNKVLQEKALEGADKVLHGELKYLADTR